MPASETRPVYALLISPNVAIMIQRIGLPGRCRVMSRTVRLGRLCATVIGLSFVAHTPTASAQLILTFQPKYESKLYINNIPAADCKASAVRVVGAGVLNLVKRAAFRAFCRATSVATNENPPTGAIVNPLDARIRGEVQLSFRCQVGNPLPLAPTFVVAGPTAAGPEGPGLVGVVNPPATRDDLAVNGGWGFVLSGRPNRLVEPAFQFFRARANPDIWHKFRATVTCGVDARGLPTATINRTMIGTWFPSHKVWFYAGSATAPPGALVNLWAQRSFGDLWFLPVIPAP